MGAVAGATPGSRQFLTFHVAGEEYALDILCVREIVPCGGLTQVPSVPTPIRGVMNLRGHVIAVLDLALLFGLPETERRKRTCVVIVDAELAGEPARLGLLGDAVGQVLDVGEDAIEPAPPFGTRAGALALQGMVRREERFILLLGLGSVIEQLDAAAGEPAWAPAAGVAPDDTENAGAGAG